MLCSTQINTFRRANCDWQKSQSSPLKEHESKSEICGQLPSQKLCPCISMSSTTLLQAYNLVSTDFSINPCFFNPWLVVCHSYAHLYTTYTNCTIGHRSSYPLVVSFSQCIPGNTDTVLYCQMYNLHPASLLFI